MDIAKKLDPVTGRIVWFKLKAETFEEQRILSALDSMCHDGGDCLIETPRVRVGFAMNKMRPEHFDGGESPTD